jgi:Spy/CpxP family protein refolding chaperone
MSTGLKWKLAVGFLLVFLAGVTTGSVAWNWHRHARFFDHSRSGPLADRMNERLRHELGLTSEQSAKIAPMIEQSAKKLETIRRESARRVRQTLTETHLQISPDLTPEQRKKLAAIEEKHRRRGDRHRGFSKPPPPPEESPVP